MLIETVKRFRVVRYDDLPEGHKAERRKLGLPEISTNLVASFDYLEDAEKYKAAQEVDAPSFWIYDVIDHGASEYVDEKDLF